jgi:exonuclease, DNA polymerase III, epsilon subunit family
MLIVSWIFLGIGVFCLIGVALNVKKYGSFKKWKEAEKKQGEEFLRQKQAEVEEKERLEQETKEKKERLAEKRKQWRREHYDKRVDESREFPELSYPPIGEHEFPDGYRNIPIPSYIVYDLETTGLTPTHDEILEIGAIRVVNGDITGVFHEYIRPNKSIPPKVTEINGITNEKVADSRTINEVLPDFIEFTERLPMVAYNAEFDYEFMKEAQLRIEGKKFVRKHYCAMEIYKKYHKQYWGSRPISAKLTSAVREICGDDYHEEFIKNNHSALVDASATQIIFETIGGIINKS